ncbi:molybdopterin oxidoreductase family protein [Actinoplanes sp. LDG1-01]|uniref:Molybdopterin oxidoreductase family protein n=1 Tax=Paractinoplanes lichenicola TaxID=2802976 RepID=A0ABS1VXX6_9ACTN|nr:molybdopterin oxidoreductase family protein [Actinoplanes lichenicola]MBL7259346.1 molybdopterin oxidoreductase family protein [Actinoplanes lichenicola]
MTATDTHCPYCALQCGMTLTPEIPRVRLEPRDFPVNKGGLCAKGFSAADLLDHRDRLLTPLVRKGHGLREASWDEAFDRIVEAIHQAQTTYGRDSVGAFGGGGLTNEKAYALGKFVRVSLRSSSIDYNGRFCMSSAATAANRSLGIDRGLPFPLEDVAGANTVLIVGANPAEAMPPSMQYLEGTRFIVVDPRRTKTAAGAHLHLQPLPGTDLALANGLLHIAIREGYVDADYIERRTTGFEAVAQAVTAYWPGRVERMTGVPEGRLRHVARMLATEGPAMILTARGAEQHSNGTDTAQAYLNLALALGLVGKPFSGYGTITGQGNGQGGREHGQKADQLPGYRKLDDPAAREHVAKVWGIDPDELPGPGRSAYEMLTDDRLKVLLVLASNIAVSAPNSNRIRRQLEKLDFLVVSDIFLSETAELADVVLPAAQWAEEEGTMTNLEGRVLRRKRALPPPPDVRTDLEVLAELSRRLGREESSDPRTVFEELRRASAGGIADYAGITYERIEREDGIFWPCPAEDHPGTPRLFADSFPTPTGKARLLPVVHQDPAEMPDKAFPYVLTTGRNMQHYQSGNQTRRVKALTVALPEPRAEIHPDLARRHGIADGDLVELRSRRGAAVLRARLTDGIRPDTVFAPFHWPGANALTNPALDPHSRMPAFKACAVTITLHKEGTD